MTWTKTQGNIYNLTDDNGKLLGFVALFSKLYLWLSFPDVFNPNTNADFSYHLTLEQAKDVVERYVTRDTR